MTWSEIDAYCRLRDIRFSQLEIDYILTMNSWANAQIKKMRDSEE